MRSGLEAYEENMRISTQAGELVEKIATSSEQQASGIEQISLAMTQIDSVTQQSAANAEESAAASQELSSQARLLSNFVNQLIQMVGRDRSADRLTTEFAAVQEQTPELDQTFDQAA